MKRALLYGLSLALLLSLAACRRAQTGQEPQEPAPAASSAPEDASAPEQSSGEQREELSEDELLDYFQLVYDSGKAAEMDSPEEQVKLELDLLETICRNDNKELPSGYWDQYRAWRPVEEQPARQPAADPVPVSAPSPGNAKDDIKTPGDSTVTKTDNGGRVDEFGRPVDENGFGIDIYNGHDTYEEYITEICNEFPDRTREELERIFPDQATGHTDEAAAAADAAAGLFNH